MSTFQKKKITQKELKLINSNVYTLPFLLVCSEIGPNSLSGREGAGGKARGVSKSTIGIISVCSVISLTQKTYNECITLSSKLD